ncbi:MAG TPA: glycosyltransferase family 39 protein [Rhizomicrobium sp.]|jgi:hypothetical protein|nr:glycosyltransferase family 39 protein [Rhizomicrobium sp.]
MSDAGKRGLWNALGEARTIYSILLIYCGLHLILRMGLSANFSHAEAEQIVFGQSFQWAYRPGEPPLAAWLSYGAFAAGGRAAVFLLKYAAMALGLFSLFGAGRVILGDVRLAAFATFAAVTGYTFGYLAHADMLSGVLTFSICCGFVWAASQALTRGAPKDYLWLGLIGSLGTLNDYAFLALPVAFAIAVVLTPGMRVRPRPLLGAVLLVLVIVAAYIWMVFGHPLAADGAQSVALMKGAGNYGLAIVFFTLPFVMAFAAIFPRALLPLANGAAQDRRWLRVLGLTILIATVLLLAASMLSGAGKFEPARIAPAFVPLVLWLFLRVKIAGWDVRAGRFFLWFAVATVVLAGVARVAVFELGAPYCKNCGDYWPTQRFATSIGTTGFAKGTIVADSIDLGADLKQWLPDARVVVAGSAPDVFGPAQGLQCLVVWRGNGDMDKAQADYLAYALEARVGANAVRGDVEALLETSKTRRDRLSFVLLPTGSGRCN